MFENLTALCNINKITVTNLGIEQFYLTTAKFVIVNEQLYLTRVLVKRLYYDEVNPINMTIKPSVRDDFSVYYKTRTIHAILIRSLLTQAIQNRNIAAQACRI